MTKYAEFDKQVAVEQQRLSDLCNSCQVTYFLNNDYTLQCYYT